MVAPSILKEISIVFLCHPFSGAMYDVSFREAEGLVGCPAGMVLSYKWIISPPILS